MDIVIKDLAYYLPQKIVSNKDIQEKHPEWDIAKVALKSGVHQRHIAEQNETAFDLAKLGLFKFFQNSSVNIKDIDGIIFCTQSPDYIMPSNAFLIHKEFKFETNVWAFDYNLACSGFVYGLAIARGMILSGMGRNVLLINADTYSKYINEGDRATSVLFGDGAAVTLLSMGNGNEGIIDISLATAGDAYESFYIPAGGCRIPKSDETSIVRADQSGNLRSLENIQMNGFAVWKFISRTVPIQIKEILDKNNLSVDQIDKFIFHQASSLTIDSLVKSLNIDASKVFTNLEKVGNTVSASIPIALKDALILGEVKSGDIVLLSGFGVGLSWGSVLIKI